MRTRSHYHHDNPSDNTPATTTATANTTTTTTTANSSHNQIPSDDNVAASNQVTAELNGRSTTSSLFASFFRLGKSSTPASGASPARLHRTRSNSGVAAGIDRAQEQVGTEMEGSGTSAGGARSGRPETATGKSVSTNSASSSNDKTSDTPRTNAQTNTVPGSAPKPRVPVLASVRPRVRTSLPPPKSMPESPSTRQSRIQAFSDSLDRATGGRGASSSSTGTPSIRTLKGPLQKPLKLNVAHKRGISMTDDDFKNLQETRRKLARIEKEKQALKKGASEKGRLSVGVSGPGTGAGVAKRPVVTLSARRDGIPIVRRVGATQKIGERNVETPGTPGSAGSSSSASPVAPEKEASGSPMQTDSPTPNAPAADKPSGEQSRPPTPKPPVSSTPRRVSLITKAIELAARNKERAAQAAAAAASASTTTRTLTPSTPPAAPQVATTTTTTPTVPTPSSASPTTAEKSTSTTGTMGRIRKRKSQGQNSIQPLYAGGRVIDYSQERDFNWVKNMDIIPQVMSAYGGERVEGFGGVLKFYRDLKGTEHCTTAMDSEFFEKLCSLSTPDNKFALLLLRLETILFHLFEGCSEMIINTALDARFLPTPTNPSPVSASSSPAVTASVSKELQSQKRSKIDDDLLIRGELDAYFALGRHTLTKEQRVVYLLGLVKVAYEGKPPEEAAEEETTEAQEKSKETSLPSPQPSTFTAINTLSKASAPTTTTNKATTLHILTFKSWINSPVRPDFKGQLRLEESAITRLIEAHKPQMERIVDTWCKRTISRLSQGRLQYKAPIPVLTAGSAASASASGAVAAAKKGEKEKEKEKEKDAVARGLKTISAPIAPVAVMNAPTPRTPTSAKDTSPTTLARTNTKISETLTAELTRAIEESRKNASSLKFSTGVELLSGKGTLQAVAEAEARKGRGTEKEIGNENYNEKESGDKDGNEQPSEKNAKGKAVGKSTGSKSKEKEKEKGKAPPSEATTKNSESSRPPTAAGDPAPTTTTPTTSTPNSRYHPPSFMALSSSSTPKTHPPKGKKRTRQPSSSSALPDDVDSTTSAAAVPNTPAIPRPATSSSTGSGRSSKRQRALKDKDVEVSDPKSKSCETPTSTLTPKTSTPARVPSSSSSVPKDKSKEKEKEREKEKEKEKDKDDGHGSDSSSSMGEIIVVHPRRARGVSNVSSSAGVSTSPAAAVQKKLSPTNTAVGGSSAEWKGAEKAQPCPLGRSTPSVGRKDGAGNVAEVARQTAAPSASAMNEKEKVKEKEKENAPTSSSQAAKSHPQPQKSTLSQAPASTQTPKPQKRSLAQVLAGIGLERIPKNISGSEKVNDKTARSDKVEKEKEVQKDFEGDIEMTSAPPVEETRQQENVEEEREESPLSPLPPEEEGGEGNQNPDETEDEQARLLPERKTPTLERLFEAQQAKKAAQEQAQAQAQAEASAAEKETFLATVEKSPTPANTEDVEQPAGTSISSKKKAPFNAAKELFKEMVYIHEKKSTAAAAAATGMPTVIPFSEPSSSTASTPTPTTVQVPMATVSTALSTIPSTPTILALQKRIKELEEGVQKTEKDILQEQTTLELKLSEIKLSISLQPAAITSLSNQQTTRSTSSLSESGSSTPIPPALGGEKVETDWNDLDIALSKRYNLMEESWLRTRRLVRQGKELKEELDSVRGRLRREVDCLSPSGVSTTTGGGAAVMSTSTTAGSRPPLRIFTNPPPSNGNAASVDITSISPSSSSCSATSQAKPTPPPSQPSQPQPQAKPPSSLSALASSTPAGPQLFNVLLEWSKTSSVSPSEKGSERGGSVSSGNGSGSGRGRRGRRGGARVGAGRKRGKK